MFQITFQAVNKVSKANGKAKIKTNAEKKTKSLTQAKPKTKTITVRAVNEKKKNLSVYSKSNSKTKKSIEEEFE